VNAERKRIAILTRDGPEHRYVVNALCAKLAIDRIIVDRRSHRPNLRRGMGKGAWHFLNKAARGAFLRVIGDNKARARSLQRVLGSGAQAFFEADKIEYVEGVNSRETIALLKQVDPNAILVYGTSVVNNAILKLARDICLNMHTGISPYYRGTQCAFWPIVNGEFDMIGATVHECTPALDGGPIFETVHARYEPGDDLHAIFGRTVAAGADAYVRVVQHYLAGTLSGAVQDLRLGREYRGSDLSLFSELIARFRVARLRAGKAPSSSEKLS
jgi:methionyl-tRNA formyltransferase